MNVRTTVKYFKHFSLLLPASRSSGNAFISEAGGLRFNPRASRIELRVTFGLPPLRHFFFYFQEAELPARNDVEMGPVSSLYASA